MTDNLNQILTLTQEEAEELASAPHDVMLKMAVEGRHMGRETYITPSMLQEYEIKGLKDKHNGYYFTDKSAIAIQEAKAGFGPRSIANN